MRISDWSSDVCSSDLLIRSGAAPSSFESASLGNINAFLAYAGRTGRLADLGAQDRVLAQAYLAFLRGGGNPDLFADGFTDLTEAYFAFVRGGGRSEEHTAELQSLMHNSYAVFCLNKKKVI